LFDARRPSEQFLDAGRKVVDDTGFETCLPPCIKGKKEEKTKNIMDDP
jgi:hypothetical protein